MLVLGGVVADPEAGRTMLSDVVANGAALEKFAEVITAQGGDASVLDEPHLLAHAPDHLVITADRAGVVKRADALDIGVAAMRLGAGRATKTDVIDPSVGTTVAVKVGDEVEEGDILATLHHSSGRGLEEAERLTRRAFVIGPGPVARPPLVHEEVR